MAKYQAETNIILEKLFRLEGKSCTTIILISFCSRVSDAVQERDGCIDCIYLDFIKAFYKVPLNRFLWKMEHVGGIKGKLLQWMKDSSAGREMRTAIRYIN